MLLSVDYINQILNFVENGMQYGASTPLSTMTPYGINQRKHEQKKSKDFPDE
jgi:hypothetical protein